MAKRKVYTITRGQRRHGALWEAWRKSGLTQEGFARTLHMSPQSFNMLLNLLRIPEDPRALPLAQQQALYRWTGLLPEELWPRPSEDFLDAAEAHGAMARIGVHRLADERIAHPDDELGRLACTRATICRLDPFSQRVVEQVAIAEKAGELVGQDRTLSRERISQLYRAGIKRLRDLAQQGLLECCT